jgi:capsular polysaccharide transport system permease protein
LTDLSPLTSSTALDVERSREMASAISRALRRAARQARQPTPLIVGGGVPVRRGERAFRLGLIASFVAVVLVPALAAGVYWQLIASAQYATEAKFSLRSNDSSGSGMLSGFAGLPTSRQAQDTQIIISYIQSPALLKDLINAVNLPAAYSYSSIDYLSRLPPNPPIERFEKYWKKYVDVQYDNSSGIVSVNVRAFTPEDSKKISAEIVRLSESVVNELADRPRRDALEQAKLEMTRAEEGLEEATRAMRNARNSEGVLDANVSAQAISNIISALRLKLMETEGALALQAQNAPQVRVFNTQIGKLKQEISNLNGQIAENGDSPSMANHLSALSLVQTKLDVARERYAIASATYQSARIDTETQQTYVIAFQQPILAQKSTYPRRWLEWLIIAGPDLALWGLGAALVVMARDNMAK